MSTELAKIIADFQTQLATTLDVAGTSATLQSATDDDGVSLPTGRYFFTIDGDNSQKEHISCDLNGTALTNIKTVSRQGVETAGALRRHRVGASVTITDFAHIKVINDLLDGTTALDSTNPLKYDGLPTIDEDEMIATKNYVDGVAIAGAADASTTVKGISKLSTAPASPTDPVAVGTNDTRVPTQDENDALQGTSGTPSNTNRYVTNDDTSATGDGSKIVRGTSGKIANSWLPSNLIPSLASGENLTAGDPVYISPIDSQVYKAHGFKELDSTFWNVTISTSNKVSKLSDTQLMFLTNSSGTLTITVYDINSASSVATQTVTTSFDTTSISATRPGATVSRLSDTTFIVFYARTSSSTLYFRTGTISGGTITMDTETAFSGSPTFCYGLDSTPSDENGKVVLTYFDSTATVGSSATIEMKLSYLTCSTNTATVTYTTSYSLASGTYFTQPYFSRAIFTKGIAYGLFNCINAGNYYQFNYNIIDTTNGNTANNLDIPNIEIPSGAGGQSTFGQYLSYFAGHNGRAYFGYQTAVDATGVETVFELSPIGGKVVYENTYVGTGATGATALKVFGNEMGVMVTQLSSMAGGSNTSIYIQKDKIIPLTKSSTFGINNTLPGANYSNTKDEIIICYPNSSGFIKQWKMPTLIDGFALETVTAPAVVGFLPNGITTGLTAGKKYYLKDSYTNPGEISTNGIVPIGDALSTTFIKG
jgi:hypothetical protein